MSREKWIEDRLFVLEQLVHQALRRMPKDQQLEILHAVRTTCEERPGTAAMAEHLVEWAEEVDDSGDVGSGTDRFFRYAEEMRRIYGDLSPSE